MSFKAVFSDRSFCFFIDVELDDERLAHRLLYIASQHVRIYRQERLTTYHYGMSSRLSISRLPFVREALLTKPDPEVFHITAKNRVHERVVSGAWTSGMQR